MILTSNTSFKSGEYPRVGDDAAVLRRVESPEERLGAVNVHSAWPLEKNGAGFPSRGGRRRYEGTTGAGSRPRSAVTVLGRL